MVATGLLIAACNGTTGAPAGSAAGDAAVGNASKGDGGGTRDVTAAAPDGGGPASAVTLTNLAKTNLAWVAFQDGDGPWQTVDGAKGVYSLPVAGPRYGLAFLCDLGNLTAGEIIQATVAELPQVATNCDGVNPAANHLKVTIRGLEPAVEVAVSAGSAFVGYGVPTTARSFDLSVAPGTYDVVGLALLSGAQRQPVKVAFARGVDASGDAAATLDFGAEHWLVEQPLSVVGAAEPPEVFVSLTTGLGTTTSFQAPAGKFYSLAGRDLGPGDIQELTVSATSISGGTVSERGVVLGLAEPQPLTVSLPPALSSPKVAAIGGAPYLRPRLTLGPYPGATLYQLMAVAGPPSLQKQWLVILSASWQRDGQGYDFPDFSGVRGFATKWALQPQDDAQFEVDAAQSSRDFARTINSDHMSSPGSKLSYAKAIVPLQP
jgi:hypothetical protein